MLVALFLLAACGGDEDRALPPTALRTEQLTPVADAPVAGDPGVTVANVVQACREKDGERLRSFVAGRVSEAEIEALFARGSDVQLLSHTVPEPEDGRATVTVRLRVRRDGGAEDVERSWELERGADGVWRLTALPDCY